MSDRFLVKLVMSDYSYQTSFAILSLHGFPYNLNPHQILQFHSNQRARTTKLTAISLKD
jgi:hypothetical protein